MIYVRLALMLVTIGLLARIWWVRLWVAGINLGECRANHFIRSLKTLY